MLVVSVIVKVVFAIVAIVGIMAVLGIRDKETTRIMKGLTIAILVTAMALFLSASSPAGKPQDKLAHDTRYTVAQTRAALDSVKEIKQDIAKGADFDTIARELYDAQERWGIPSLFMVAIGWHESRYGLDRVGSLKERGIMQVGPMGVRRCKEFCGEMETEREQIQCGACWLVENIDWCGTFPLGFNGYASGKCKPTGAGAKSRIHRRFDLWEKLHYAVMYPAE